MSGRRLLVVEDDEDLALVCGALLELRGHCVDIAHDPLRALALARNNHYDCALVDVALPGGGGSVLAEGLRKIPDLPVIALAGYSGEDVPRDGEYLQRFAAHLVKPITVDAVDRVLRRVLGGA